MKMTPEMLQKRHDLNMLKEEISNEFAEYLRPTIRLSKIHHLVSDAKIQLNKAKNNYDGYLRCESQNHLNVYVSKQLLPKALRVFNSFIQLAHARNHEVSIKNEKTVITINDVDLEVSVREKMKRVLDENHKSKYGYEYYRNAPSGILIFRMDELNKREWISEKKSIEEQFASIMAKLESYAAEQKRWKIRIEENRIMREAEEKIIKLNNERKLLEIEKVKKLIEATERWELAERIRRFLDGNNSYVTNDMKINWGLGIADWIDPTVNKNNEILGPYFPTINSTKIYSF